MANTKITELTAVTALAGTDVFPVVDVSASTTNKVSVEDLLRSVPNGTAGAPSVANAGDRDTGIFFPAASSVGVSTDGTQRLVIDSSGRVGIATASPSTRFHLTGTDDNFITLDHATRTGSWIIKHSGSNSGSLEFQQNNGSTTVRSYLAGRNIHEFHTNGSERLRIDSTGRVGIGASSPGEKLTLGGEENPTIRLHTSQQNDNWSASSEYGKLQWFSNDYEYLNGGEMASISVGVNNSFGTNPSIRFKTTSTRATGAVPTEHMRLTSTGQLLLGTTTEGEATADNLTIADSGHCGMTVRSGTSSEGNIFFSDGTSGNAEFRGAIRYFHASDALTLTTNSGEALRIDSNRNVGIGTSLPLNRLHIVGGSATSNTGATVLVDDDAALAANIGGSIAFRGTDGTDVRTYGLIRGGKLNSGSGSFDGYLAFETRNNGQANTTERMRLTSSGRLLIGTSTSPSGGDAHSQNAPLLVQGRIGSDADSGRINLQRGSAASNGSSIGTISFTDSSNNAYGRIEVNADKATGVNDYPGRIKFSTTSNGASSPTERMRIDSSGNVGIAESAPDVRLHVKTSSDDVAKLESTSGGNGPNLILAHTGASPADDDTIGKLSFSATNDNSQETTFADIKVISTDVSDGSEDAAFAFGTRNNGTFAERLRLTSAGQLSLGTSNPTAKLHVSSSSTTAARISSSSSASYGQLQLQSSNQFLIGYGGAHSSQPNQLSLKNHVGDITFFTNVTERMRLDSSGNVGIGATDVNAPLEVRNSSALQIRTSTGTGTYWEFGRDNSTGDFFLADDGLGTVVAVDQITGDVGIGTTSPAFTEGGGLRIERASTATLRLQDTGAHGFEISASSDEAKFRTMNNKRFVFANSSNNELFRITGTGIAFNGDTAGANRLNDYEEGTFTPEFAGSTTAGTYTYLSRTGHYTKIGDMVNVTIVLTNINTSTAGTGDINITGLPFASANNSSFACGSVILDQFNTAGSCRSLAVRNNANTAILTIVETRDSLTDSLMSVGDKVNNIADIFCTITYRV